jgi:hypothetical protein
VTALDPESLPPTSFFGGFGGAAARASAVEPPEGLGIGVFCFTLFINCILLLLAAQHVRQLVYQLYIY